VGEKGYEVLTGNTSDKTTLKGMLEKIEKQYGKAERTWLMDRGIPTEEVLSEMREADPPARYLVGTPKARLNRLEQALLAKPWQEARPGVQVKLLPQDGELYVFAQSKDRVAKERSMRRRQLKWLWARLADLHRMSVNLKRDELLIKLGQAKERAPTGWRLVNVEVDNESAMFLYSLDRTKLRQVRRREGRYLLRSNLTEENPATLWEYYLQLVKIEEAFKTLKDDLAIRPIYHQAQGRIEAHIFISFLAYCLHVTLGRRLHGLAPGLTPRAVFDKCAAVQMIDVHIPTTDGRELQLTRYTQPEPDLRLLLQQLKLVLPEQPPPRITAADASALPTL
jgi:transposase